MDVRQFHREVGARQFVGTFGDVMLHAAQIADEMEHDFIDPVHVLIAILSRDSRSKLEGRLESTGLTCEGLSDLARVMPALPYRSRVATTLMFERATEWSSERMAKAGYEARLSMGDVAFACIVSGSRVIETLVCDGLQKSIYMVLVELHARDDLLQQFFPADTVEDIVATKMAAEVVEILG